MTSYILKNDKKKKMPDNVYVDQKKAAYQSLFKTIFVPLIFHREKNETAIEFNDLNRHEPLLPALEFNNAFSKKRKKKKKEEKNTESNFKELGNGKVI